MLNAPEVISIVSKPQNLKVDWRKGTVLVFTFILCAGLFGQNSNYVQIQHGKLAMHEYLKLFFESDSSFAVEHKVDEVIVYQSTSDGKEVLYNRPIMIYRWDSLGSRTYGEHSTYTEHGGNRNIVQSSKDSTITVQHQYHDNGDYRFNRKTIHKYYQLDDTLSRTIRLTYLYDSLASYEDLGIFDSRAETRRQILEMKQARDSGTLAPVAVYRLKETRTSCLIPPPYPVYKNPPAEIKEDSLGRMVECSYSGYRGLGDGNVYLVPLYTACLSYYSGTQILRSFVSWSHFDQELYHSIATKSAKTNSNPIFPRCLAPKCKYYDFRAEDLVFGIPTRITISSGDPDAPVLSYRVAIKSR